MSFTHLHVHSQQSLLDGANIISDLAQYIKQNNMEACAITDHGVMSGVIEFYKECNKNNIKPLLGVEAYITEDEDNLENQQKQRDNMHMVLIAKDLQGYRGLLKLISHAAFNNFYYKPRIYRKHLESLSGHVIATSACLGGILAKQIDIKTDDYGKAISCSPYDYNKFISTLEFYSEIFNNDFYLEIQDWDNGDNFQQVYNHYLCGIAKDMNLPLIITADAHYLKKEDSELHEMLMAMQLKMTLEEYRESGDMQYGPHFYIKTPEEMLLSAKKWDESAYYNTEEIANKCNVKIELGKYKQPIFDITQQEDYQDFIEWSKKQNWECKK